MFAIDISYIFDPKLHHGYHGEKAQADPIDLLCILCSFCWLDASHVGHSTDGAKRDVMDQAQKFLSPAGKIKIHQKSSGISMTKNQGKKKHQKLVSSFDVLKESELFFPPQKNETQIRTEALFSNAVVAPAVSRS